MVSSMAALASAVAVGAILWSVTSLPLPTRRGRSRSRSWQQEAGLDVTPFQFWVASIGAGLGTYLVVQAITGLPIVSAMPALVVGTLPRAYFSRQRTRRLAEVQEAWPDGIRDLVASIRSGSSLPTAVESLATFGPAPLRLAFQGFGVYSRSLGVVPALEMIKADLADPASDRVIEVLILAYERGGSVVPEILSDLAEATTRDIWANEQMRTEALEQKINARIVFVLPWFVLVALTAREGPFRAFYSSRAGVVVAVLGAFMSLVGILIASKLGAQPSEPRVFVTGAAR